MENLKIRTIADVEAYAKVPIEERLEVFNTYDMLAKGAAINPAVIEDPLYRLDGIQVAAAVDRPDPHAGEIPVAFVQLQEGADLTEDQILRATRSSTTWK